MAPEPYPLALILSRIFFTRDPGVVKVMGGGTTVGRGERCMFRGFQAGVGRGGLKVRMRFGRDAGNFVESVGDGADEFTNTFA